MNRITVFKALSENVNEKVSETQDYLEGLRSSRDSDTKSSAGDKYETSRSMVQQEIDRAEDRLQQLKMQLNELERVERIKDNSFCQPGSLVQLEKELFLLGPALGKISIEDNILFSISMASPLGQLLNEKKVGDTIQFRGKESTIKNIL
jgi:transcription elongation GreA/GreB family factor